MQYCLDGSNVNIGKPQVSRRVQKYTHHSGACVRYKYTFSVDCYLFYIFSLLLLSASKYIMKIL